MPVNFELDKFQYFLVTISVLQVWLNWTPKRNAVVDESRANALLHLYCLMSIRALLGRF